MERSRDQRLDVVLAWLKQCNGAVQVDIASIKIYLEHEKKESILTSEISDLLNLLIKDGYVESRPHSRNATLRPEPYEFHITGKGKRFLGYIQNKEDRNKRWTLVFRWISILAFLLSVLALLLNYTQYNKEKHISIKSQSRHGLLG
jgi:DNA-binding PadR family transcriptional regulator